MDKDGRDSDFGAGDAAFWRGRRVFLTGHTGFKGSWMVTVLSTLGAEVHGYALPPEGAFVDLQAAAADQLASSTYADIMDMDALRAALRASDAEVVIHMAAQAFVRSSYDTPVETFAVNVMGTVHMLEVIRSQPSVRAAVMVTSDKCYENREWDWGYRENEAMGGFDPYSSSKGCAELVTSAYRRSFFGPEGAAHIASARAGNVIGGGDWSTDRLVPDLIRQFREGAQTLIRNPGAVRPWQHVLEPVTGYLTLARRLLEPGGRDHAEGWNFGPDSEAEQTVSRMADAASRLWGDNAGWVRDERVHVHEAGYLKLDSSRARHVLGWTPVWSFDDALGATIAWYRAHADGQDMTAFTLQQIRDYSAARNAAHKKIAA